MIQFVDRPGIIDLAWGHPAPELLPVDAWRRAAETASGRYGWQAFAYGEAQGPAPLVDWLAARLGDTDGRAVGRDEVVVTAGASAAIQLVASRQARRGDTALVEAPSYHLAHRILADIGLRVVPVVPTEDGELNGHALRRSVEAERVAGHQVALLYTVPTYNNPTGDSLSAAARSSLVVAASDLDILILEDDTYRDLSYEPSAPRSLYCLAAAGTVVRVGSFSKTLAPGVRLGYLTAPSDTVQAIVTAGVVDSGGGLNHTSAVTLSEFGASGAFDAHLARVRTEYARRRNALAAGLTAVAEAHPGLRWRHPAGGWFLWVRLPAGLSATRLLPVAEAAGTSFHTGRTFQAGRPADDHVRLAFSRLRPQYLVEGARRLGSALAAARA